jgi:hypothetical protein
MLIFFYEFGTYQITRSWRRTRRAAHEILSKTVVRDYHPVVSKEAILLASAILKTPDSLGKHIQRATASATLTILYDHPTLKDEHDKTLRGIHAYIDHLSIAAAQGAHLVEFLPWMIHIPERYVIISPIIDPDHLVVEIQVCKVETRSFGTPQAAYGHVHRTFGYCFQ